MSVISKVDRESELALVGRLREGDLDALDDVYACFNPRLFTFLVRLSRSRDVAEDLLEETWLKLVAHSRRLRPDTELAKWLFTVARNHYVSHCRSRLVERDHEIDLMGLWPTGTPAVSPFEFTAANETTRRIESALAKMPRRYREVLLLVGIEGFQPAEAAAICGITAESLRQRLHRARTWLSDHLDESVRVPEIRPSEVLP